MIPCICKRCSGHSKLNNKHQRTLQAIFETPVRSDIRWDDVESLLKALGATIAEGRGSRVRIALNKVRAVFHEPHPKSQPMGKADVKSIRLLLENAGITPEKNIS